MSKNKKNNSRPLNFNPEIDLITELGNLRKPIAGDVSIAKVLDKIVQEGELYEKLDEGKVHCYACGHNCTIKPGARGICQVRYNIGGKLFVPWGYVAALQVDPIEKKPFYHVYPGAETLTFGMLGCDYHCSYCQNWDISQALRDERSGRPPQKINPWEMIELGIHHNAKCVASSYNEPLITSEWASSVFKEAKKEGLTCLYVSNGNATREVLEYIKPLAEGYKIDLKTMNDKHYRKLGGVLQNVLNTIQMVYDVGFWTEIVTLVVPDYNDSEEELREAARFIKSVSPDIPWHVTAFHKDYKMTGPDNTDSSILVRAAEIGYDEGLHFVYAGNDPGHVKSYENTYCPNCKTTLIERIGYLIRDYKITDDGCCPKCKTEIPGIWPKSKDEVNISSNFFMRMPRSAF